MRFVLSGYFGFKNFGDEAILSVLVKKLRQNKHSLTIISADPNYTKKQYKHVRSIYTFNFVDIVGAISKSDVLISGGGSLLQDVTSVKSLFYYLLIILIALLFHKKVIIFAQGIGPISNPFGMFFTKLLLSKCHYVSVRDKKSLELLREWGINADLVCDPVFDTKIDTSEKDNSVAVQLRGFKTVTQDFIDRLANEICKNFSDKIINIYSFQDSIDFEICRDFDKNIKMLNPEIKTFFYHGLTNDEIINKISKSEYIVAMRFHAIIIGLIAGAKILSINYDTKVEKLSYEFDLPMLDLKQPFGTQFKQLKEQNAQRQLDKKFDWTNFDLSL